MKTYKPKKSQVLEENYDTPEIDPDSIQGLSREAKTLLKSKKEIKLFNQRGRKNFINKLELEQITYKDLDILKQFLNPIAGMLPSRVTKVDRRHQREIKIAIKRAREMALLPFPNQREAGEFFEKGEK
jgi:small subunit ribosomal protein S18